MILDNEYVGARNGSGYSTIAGRQAGNEWG